MTEFMRYLILRFVVRGRVKWLMKRYWGAALVIGCLPSLGESLHYKTLVLKRVSKKDGRVFLLSVCGRVDKVFNADGSEYMPSGKSF